MEATTMLGLSDPVAAANLLVGLLAIAIAIWCVDLSLKRTSRVNALLTIRDEIMSILDSIDKALRQVPADDRPLTYAQIQMLSNEYWETKHRFDTSYRRAVVILSPRQIAPWANAMPKLEREYANFVESANSGIVNCRALNNFKAELYGALASVERIISRSFLHFHERKLANQLLEDRHKVVLRIRGT